MGNETIPLAKPFNIEKLEFPVLVSEKLDGVPVLLTVRVALDGRWHLWVFTRQGEVAASTIPDMRRFAEAVQDKLSTGCTYHWVFEVTHETERGFKDVSGIVRRKEPQTGLIYNLFDYVSYTDRVNEEFLRRIRNPIFPVIPGFRRVEQRIVETPAALEDMLAVPIPADQEGWVIRSGNAKWKPGTRHWDYQKVVKEPLLDLRVVGFEEGQGKNAGAVGKVLVEYRGAVSGVGAGKLSYTERAHIWQNQSAFIGKIATIKHKPDDGYEKLRQGTFQYWREDKKDADA